MNVVLYISRPDSIDPGVRGRFSREIALPVPDAASRTKILNLVTKGMKIASNVDMISLGKLTPGFVGADLHALAREAGMLAVSRIVEASITQSSKEIEETIMTGSQAILDSIHVEMSMESAEVCMDDFLDAAKRVQPSAKTEGFAVVPNVTWNDVGALAEVNSYIWYNSCGT